ncbi:hypothetical protein MRS44_003384 [Fusarium solani]|uniref:uncharacterized protein n=1 Tax=Fusarium solani TaxID=169388 RepID=UPI0032C408FE|nr:hypothetical protein MRS44_003384 [Fusarium solani]
MGENDLCSTSPCIRFYRRHLNDDLFVPISRLAGKITVVKERIWSKLPEGRRAKREWYAKQPALFLKGGREERRSNPDWSRDENPIQYKEPAPVGKPHRVVSNDNRVWTVIDGERLMTK